MFTLEFSCALAQKVLLPLVLTYDPSYEPKDFTQVYKDFT